MCWGPRRKKPGLRWLQHPGQPRRPRSSSGQLGSCQVPPPQAAALQGLFLWRPAAPTTGSWGKGRLRWGTGIRPRPGVTFHFGEGQDRTVAGAEWGHPGRVLLHRELCACRSHDHLHPGAGREPSVPAASSVQERQARRPGPAPAAGRAPVAALTAGATPRSTSSPPAATPQARTAFRLEVAANSDVMAKCAPHAHPASPAPPPPGTPMPQLVPP